MVRGAVWGHDCVQVGVNRVRCWLGVQASPGGVVIGGVHVPCLCSDQSNVGRGRAARPGAQGEVQGEVEERTFQQAHLYITVRGESGVGGDLGEAGGVWLT